MEPAWVQQLRVLVDLPEDNLVVHRAGNDTVSRERLDAQNVAVMPVVRVHIGHLTEVPHLQGSVLGHCVELVILLVEGDAGDGVAVTEEAFHLRLVVDVPHAHHPVLTT